MTAALGWLLGSRLGRWVACGALLAVAVALALRAARNHGRDAERAEALEARTRVLLDTIDTIRSMSDAQAAAPATRDAVLDRLRAGDA